MNGKSYKVAERSLDKWKNVEISFSGTFYDNREYKKMLFSIIDVITIDKESNTVRVKINDAWITKIQISSFFKYIDIENYRRINSPVALRFFELLDKNLTYRNNWKISLLKLGSQMCIGRRGVFEYKIYPSHVESTVKRCIPIINKSIADYKDEFSYKITTNDVGVKIVHFSKDKVKSHPEFFKDPRLADVMDFLLDDAKLHPNRIRDLIDKVPVENMLLQFEMIQDAHESGYFKTKGGIYDAFVDGWFLEESLERYDTDDEYKAHVDDMMRI